MPRGSLLVCTLVLGGCLETDAHMCGNRLCPADRVCAPSGEGCVLEEQISACLGAVEGGPCEFADNDGFCRDGLCVGAGCGDGVISGAEECEDGDLANATCLDFGFYEEEGLGCSATCRFDTGDCGIHCGDGVVNGPEDCDYAGTPDPADDDLGGADCTTLDFYDAAGLACTSFCTFNVTACTGACGDGLLNGGEDCDDSGTSDPSDDVLTATCVDLDFYDEAGLACSSVCAYDIDGCTGFCGDHAQNGGELCDELPPAGDTCVSFGFDAGLLSCSAQCAPGFSTCASAGWEPVKTWPDILYDLWGTGSGELFVAAGDGVQHFDGAAWTLEPTAADAVAVHGTGAAHVVAISLDELVHVWDGTMWTSSSTGSLCNLVDVWASGPADVYVVGEGDDGCTGGAVRHWDGTAWTEAYTSPDRFEAIDGTTTGDVYAVAGSSVYHFDGSSWQALATGTTEVKTAIRVFDTDDIFVGGELGTILHYDGATWSTQWVPLVLGSYYLTDLWGATHDEMYAVGWDLFLRFDGTSWSWRPPLVDDAAAIWSEGPGELYAVETGNAGILQRYAGMSLFDFSNGTADLNDVWVAPDAAVAVGRAGAILQLSLDTWSPAVSPTTNDLHAVWGSAPDDVFAVGVGGVIVHCDGTSWSEMVPGTGSTLFSVWGSSATDVYAAGFQSVVHYDGTSWSPVTVGATAVWSTVWGTGAGDVYVSGRTTGGGLQARHFNGSAWSASTMTTAFQISAGATGPAAVLRTPSAFGRYSTAVSTWDGATYSVIADDLADTDLGSYLLDVHASSADDVIVVGDMGTIWHFDGATWTSVRTTTQRSLRAVDGARGAWWIVGDGGMILRLARDGSPSAGCAVTIEQACSDGIDDDCDFLVDDDDPDCDAPGMCWAPVELACAMTISDTLFGGAETIARYGCQTPGAVPMSGPERVYRVVPTASGTMTAVLDATTQTPLRLFALAPTAAGVCDPAGGCSGVGMESGTMDTLSTAVTAGEPVYVVVDAPKAVNPTAATYTLQVTCP